MAPTPAAPLLTHEDDESTLTLRAAPTGYEVAITRPGLKAHYRLVAPREEIAAFAERVLEVLETKKRIADVDGPTDGKLALGATVAPGDEGELLLVLLARQASGGDEMEAEFVRFASRAQMADFAEALLGLA